MYFTKKNKIMVLLALILLNIFIRIPTFPHEAGDDSFYYQHLAKSISNEGFATWAGSPMGLFGNYDISKFEGDTPENSSSGLASSGPFLLSGISLLTGIDMEIVILIVSIFVGILGAIFSYALAKEIIDDDLFAFTAGFSFSLSPIVLLNGIWTMSTRQLFIILILILLFKLSKQTEFRKKMKYFSLLATFIILLVATHRMYLMISMIFIAYTILILNKKLDIRIFVKNKPLKILIPWIVLFIILLLPQIFKLGFFEKYTFWGGYTSGFLFEGSEWYKILLNMAVDYATNIGILVFVGLIGLFFLLDKNQKNTGELFLIYFLLIFAVISSYGTYLSLFIIPFSSLLIGIGFINVEKIFPKKTFSYILSAVLLASIIFSIFMLWHWQVFAPLKENDAYLGENTANAALFINSYNNNSTSITNSNERMFQANLNSKLLSVFNTPVLDYDYNEIPFQQTLKKHNINYYIEKNSLSGRIRDFAGTAIKINSFIYIGGHKNRIYDNGELSVWHLGEV